MKKNLNFTKKKKETYKWKKDSVDAARKLQELNVVANQNNAVLFVFLGTLDDTNFS